jgi:Rieske Fe-S protein
MSGKISRRNFIKTSAMGVVVGGALLSSLDLSAMIKKSSKGKVSISDGDIIVNLKDAKNEALNKVGGSIMLDDEKILIKASLTQFTALSLICKHKGCTVELSGDKFVCPCHGSEYDLKGTVTQGPSKKDLDIYETIFDDAASTVTVKIPKKKE